MQAAVAARLVAAARAVSLSLGVVHAVSASGGGAAPASEVYVAEVQKRAPRRAGKLAVRR